MFTVCPKCALTLVVTAADLRVAQGYVRCGRCSSVFNALARLTEERGGASLPAAEAAAALERAAAQADGAAAAVEEPAVEVADPMEDAAAPEARAEEESPPDEALEFNPATTDVNSVFVQPPPDPQWTAATGSFKALMAANDEPVLQEPSAGEAVEVEIDAAFFASMLSAESAPQVPKPRPVPVPAAANEPSAAPAAERMAKPATRATPAAARLPRQPAPPRAWLPPRQPRPARRPYPYLTAPMPMATASFLRRSPSRRPGARRTLRTMTRTRRPRRSSPCSRACASTAGHSQRWSRCCCSVRRS